MLLLVLTTLFYLLYKAFMLPFRSIRSSQFLSWTFGSVIYMLLIILPTFFSLLYKDFLPPFGSIRSLRFQSWNCGSLMFILLFMLLSLLYLLNKGFMLPVFIQVVNSGSVTIFRLLFLLTVFSMVPWKYISCALSTQTPLYI